MGLSGRWCLFKQLTMVRKTKVQRRVLILRELWSGGMDFVNENFFLFTFLKQHLVTIFTRCFLRFWSVVYDLNYKLYHNWNVYIFQLHTGQYRHWRWSGNHPFKRLYFGFSKKRIRLIRNCQRMGKRKNLTYFSSNIK